jgi:hypothetical protein
MFIDVALGVLVVWVIIDIATRWIAKSAIRETQRAQVRRERSRWRLENPALAAKQDHAEKTSASRRGSSSRCFAWSRWRLRSGRCPDGTRRMDRPPPGALAHDRRTATGPF